MNEMQQQTDIQQAKSKLVEVEQTKAARNDPRGGVEMTAPKTPATDGRKKEIRPVTAKPKKPKFSQKLKEAMFSEDIGNGSVTEYVFFRIFIPSVKRILSDMANSAINMALGLDPKTRTVGSAPTHTQNASLYRDRNYNRPEYTGDSRQREAISELKWDEATANDIYNQMSELIDHYGECSIADVYSIMGLGTRIRTTDRRWGWITMRGIEVKPADINFENWYIDVPGAVPLSR